MFVFKTGDLLLKLFNDRFVKRSPQFGPNLFRVPVE
jgi:hypothetical protein